MHYHGLYGEKGCYAPQTLNGQDILLRTTKVFMVGKIAVHLKALMGRKYCYAPAILNR